MRTVARSKMSIVLSFVVLAVVVSALMVAGLLRNSAVSTHAASPQFAAQGDLDCNGYSKIQTTIKPVMQCSDPQGYDNSRFYDNGHYIGHDEPSVQFLSNAPGSGNNLQWQIKLPQNHPFPATQEFENGIAFWFNMAICDPKSYPQNSCTPDSDTNTGGEDNPKDAGSAFLELQFYPPGYAPQISCDQTHWCAALNIDSLECSFAFAFCNPNCTEPVNFAFIQMNGVPPGPPGPASANNSTFTPNNETLLMDQGDTINITIKDTPHGVINIVQDQTTGSSGFMVASAHNGFQDLDLKTCAPTNFTFHPEYSTAKLGNDVPWAALQTQVGFAYEIGHFEHPDGDADDPPCFTGPKIPGCLGADVDFDGTSYQPDWADGLSNTPTPLRIDSVSQNGFGPLSAPKGSNNYSQGYSAYQFETDIGASETTCKPSGSGCKVPPPGAVFYPFYAQSGTGARCNFTFGNDIRGSTINDFGRDQEYGTPYLQWFFGTDSGGIVPNPCTPHGNS